MKSFLLLASLMAACGFICTHCTGEQVLRPGTSWQVKDLFINDTAVRVPAGQAVTLIFADSTNINGHAGCNSYFGHYKTGENCKIRLNPAGITKMYCPDINFEDKFIRTLSLVDSYQLKDRILTLKDGKGNPLMLLEPFTRPGHGEKDHPENNAGA